MLVIKDLHVKFDNRDREAVAGVSLTIEDGEILGLVGESGSGKSVTAMSIAGLLPRKQCTYSGDILLDGQDLLHAKRSDLRKIHGAKIGVVFQEPMSSMDPLMKVGEQVGEALRILLPAITIGFNNAVLAEASMSFLGIGVTPPDASLGYMLSEAQGMLKAGPWYAIFTGLSIILLVFGVGLIGEGLQAENREVI